MKKVSKKTFTQPSSKKGGSQNNFMVIDELRKILKNKPSDFKTREKLVSLLFDQKMYLPALKESLLLIDASVTNPEVSELKYTVLTGEAHFYLSNIAEAKKYFMIAKKIDDLDFSANYFLARIEFDNENYERALAYINISARVNPTHKDTLKLKGFLSFQTGSYRDCVNAMAQYLELEPSDVESTYYLGYSYFKLNKTEEAKRLLTPLMNHERYFIEASFVIASIHKKDKSFVQAIQIFEGLLKHKEKFHKKKSFYVELLYMLGECYFNVHNTAKALYFFEEVGQIDSSYKDVQQKIELYSQFTKNTLLEKYLVGSVNEFTNICKMFVNYYATKYSTIKGTVKFINVELNSRGEMEIRAEVSNNKFVLVYYFIFFRSNTIIGDFVLRNIYNMLKDDKTDKGVCISAGTFSESAMQFVESRMLEIVEKEQLTSILKEISHLLKNN